VKVWLAAALTSALALAHTSATFQPTGQAPQAPRTGTGLILGRVVDSETNKPLESALVSYTVAGTTPPVRDRVKTDALGRFVFFNLIAGTYNFAVAKANYSNFIGGVIRLTVADGQKIGDFTIRLTPATSTQGVIGGLVTDETGEPVVGAHVMLLTSFSGGSGSGFWQAGGGQTDDRGIYRVLAIRGAGQYLVMVTSTLASVPLTTLDALDDLRQTGRSVTEIQRELSAAGVVIGTEAPPRPGSPGAMLIGGVVQAIGDLVKPPRIGSDGRLYAYPTTFYPGTLLPARAVKVTLRRGEERTGIDIRLNASPVLRVSGTLTGPNGPAANVAVRLVARDPGDLQSDLDIATTLADPAGRFTFVAVPPGEYVVKASRIPRPTAAPSQSTVVETGTDTVTMSGGLPLPAPASATPAGPTLWASAPVTVSDADVSGLEVVLREGARISGHVEFAGATPRPAADQLARAAVTVATPDGRNHHATMAAAAPSLSGRVAADGQFTTLGLPPASYIIGLSGAPAGWTLKSVMVGGRDVAESPVDVGTAHISDVAIILSDRLTGLNGRVTAPAGSGTSVAGVTVIVFPAERQRWTGFGVVPRRIGAAAAAIDGTYAFPDLPPGAYFVVAISSPLPRDWRDARFLDTLVRQATRVQLNDGQKKLQDLAVSRLR
jgi:carboxypeptidase family protein